MKDFMRFLLGVLAVLCISAMCFAGTYGGGSGALADPYIINEPNHLQELASTSTDWYRCFSLTADLDMAGISMTAIGTGSVFSGFFNGNHHTISNLTINGFYEFAGLFACVGSFPGPWPGIIQNLHLENASVTGDKSAGALAGTVYKADIINCSSSGSVHAMGTVYGGAWAGGIAGGISYDGTVRNCYSTCAVSAGGALYSFAGGLVGEARGLIENCYAGGTISADTAGGFAGAVYESSISNCYSSSYLEEGCWRPGGFIGSCSSVIFTDCFWDMDASGETDAIGNGSATGILGRTTNNMKIRSTFTSWDFVDDGTDGANNIWRMCVDGVDYPRLSWEFAQNGDFACGDGVDIFDLQSLAEHWLLVEADDPGVFNYACDANGDEAIDLLDFQKMAENW